MYKQSHMPWWQHLVLCCVCGVVLTPIMLILWGSLGAPGSETGQWTTEHWRLVLGFAVQNEQGKWIYSPYPALTWLVNSLKVAFIYAILATSLAAMAAYGLVRKHVFASKPIANSLLFLQFFPSVLALVAVYILLRKLGVYMPSLGVNSHGGLVVVYLGGLAFFIWFLKGQISGLPSEYEESARLSSARAWQIMMHIILPLLLPGLLVTFLISFMMAFGEFPFASILLQQQDQYTLAVGSQLYLSDHYYNWGEFCAFALLSASPAVILLLLIQYWLLQFSQSPLKESGYVAVDP
ncbi:ABC transporter permease subunit [Motilimonas sp. 1_MG-2023]|uniref:ABC transporter permease subunit n=1 Tax=Motilimonas TaxID=1914248 RepID=UPI001E4703C3|nr:ABC transporter permease subunit [Motilimonas sp. 1_MG-2023]MCE0557951.1 ABC transporter permease subunit [Motilimonas sp. E26]MDO6524755.1 ABC transporter permease subunit [Motilimonas sp. 1_MG-2023]